MHFRPFSNTAASVKSKTLTGSCDAGSLFCLLFGKFLSEEVQDDPHLLPKELDAWVWSVGKECLVAPEAVNFDCDVVVVSDLLGSCLAVDLQFILELFYFAVRKNRTAEVVDSDGLLGRLTSAAG